MLRPFFQIPNAMTTADQATADAFATSWNNLPPGSVYTPAQFADWMAPLTEADFRGADVLELGCGNGSLLVHSAAWRPRRLVGVDLGASVKTAEVNLARAGVGDYRIEQADLTLYRSQGFDLVYCIGVLHHLRQPKVGFDSVLRNVRPGGRFHCWVYAKEGNRLVIAVVDPLRKLASRLPWWLNKYLIATPLAVPFYLYAKTLRVLDRGLKGTWRRSLARAPLFEYCLWIAEREFAFFRHVAFDQLVTPQTVYIAREEIQDWLGAAADLEPGSTYIIQRNGNSWKFGGRKAAASTEG